MCQRSAGAPVVAWAHFPVSSLKYEGSEPSLYRSSENTQRGFCPKCGSSICVVDDGDELLCITLATLDRPEAVTPAYDSHLESSLPWMHWQSRNR
ncbi:MAG: GFA family protein [Lyngbya sp. HA4199-MV5]|nr:GFA family protein [Lyngbya sp. HA4199-MV5]